MIFRQRILGNIQGWRRYMSTGPNNKDEILKIKAFLEKSDQLDLDITKKKQVEPKQSKMKSPNKSDDDGPKIMKELAKLTPMPLKWRASNQEYTSIARFLTLAQVNLEWSIYDYDKIPELANGKELPEVIFLGRCNVGKSSLINALLSKKKDSVVQSYARVKQQAGYTPCLNFYNIGGKFRLVDCPGYGIKGREWQGNLIFEYLQKRTNLQNTYLILDAEVGLNEYDELILQNLTDMAVRFDIIFNKIDKIPKEQRLPRILELVNKGVIGNLNMKPRCYAVSCNEKARSGIAEVMISIIESCGIWQNGQTGGLDPVKKKHVVRAEVARQRYKLGKKEHKEKQRKQIEEAKKHSK